MPASDRPGELVDEPGLADPGHADQRHELRRALLAHPPKRRDEQLELALTTHERVRQPARHVDAETRPRSHRLPPRDGAALALRDNRIDLPILEHLCGRGMRLLTHEHTVRRRRRLQASSRVHYISRDERLTLTRPRRERHERLTRVEGDAHLQLLTLVERPVADRERRPHRAFRIVLVRKPVRRTPPSPRHR